VGLAPRGAGEPAVAEPHEPADAGGQTRRPPGRIARETSPAGPAVPGLYPGMDGDHEGAGAGRGEGAEAKGGG